MVALNGIDHGRFSVAPQLDNVIADLELMPLRLNQGKASKMGQRQLDLMRRLQGAGLTR